MNETYYSILEVSETASGAEIKTAYRRLMIDVHPDRLANAPAYWQRKAEEKAKEINEAFGVLSNPEKRRLYDASLGLSRGSQDKGPAATSGRQTSQRSAGAGQHEASTNRSESGSGANHRSASPPPPRDAHSQPGSTSRPGTVPNSSNQPYKTGPSQRERLFFSLVVALFGFGAAVDFWQVNSGGEGTVLFVLAGVLLFWTAWIHQNWAARLWSLVRVRRPRTQVFATICGIAIFLSTGKIAANLSRSAAPPHPAASSDLGSVSPSPSLSSVTNEPPAPVDPSAFEASLPNGTEILRRHRNSGHGTFTVDNGTGNDAVVELVDASTEKAIRAFYVDAGMKFTEQHIGSGTYRIYYMTGQGWNATTRQFLRRGEYGVFDQAARFEEQHNDETGEIDFHRFSITIQPVVGGTAQTSGLDADAFAKAMIEGDLE